MWKFACQAPTAALGHDSLGDQSRDVYSAVEARRLAQPAGSAVPHAACAGSCHWQALTHRCRAVVSKPPQPQSQIAAEPATEPTMAAESVPQQTGANSSCLRSATCRVQRHGTGHGAQRRHLGKKSPHGYGPHIIASHDSHWQAAKGQSNTVKSPIFENRDQLRTAIWSDFWHFAS
eukprot:COSAG06_NODE_22156_length_732_cov_1.129542_1_plen_176_part_00